MSTPTKFRAVSFESSKQATMSSHLLLGKLSLAGCGPARPHFCNSLYPQRGGRGPRRRAAKCAPPIDNKQQLVQQQLTISCLLTWPFVIKGIRGASSMTLAPPPRTARHSLLHALQSLFYQCSNTTLNHTSSSAVALHHDKRQSFKTVT